jgi:hypothetical protein
LAAGLELCLAFELRFVLALGLELGRAFDAVVAGFDLAAVLDFDDVAALGFDAALALVAGFDLAAVLGFDLAAVLGFDFAAVLGFDFAAVLDFDDVAALGFDAALVLVAGFAEPLELFLALGAEPLDDPLPPRVRDLLCADLLLAAIVSPFWIGTSQRPIYPLLGHFKPKEARSPQRRLPLGGLWG